MTLGQIILVLLLLGVSGLSILLVIGRPGPTVRKKRKRDPRQ